MPCPCRVHAGILLFSTTQCLWLYVTSMRYRHFSIWREDWHTGKTAVKIEIVGNSQSTLARKRNNFECGENNSQQFSDLRMRSSLVRMRSSLVRMRSSLVVRASDCQCTSCNGPGFDTSIRRHSGIWGAADEAVLNIVRTIRKKIPPKNI